MNEHQKIAELLYAFLSSDHVSIPGSRGNDVQNAKGWLAAIVQGQLHVHEVPNIKLSAAEESPPPIS